MKICRQKRRMVCQKLCPIAIPCLCGIHALAERSSSESIRRQEKKPTLRNKLSSRGFPDSVSGWKLTARLCARRQCSWLRNGAEDRPVRRRKRSLLAAAPNLLRYPLTSGPGTEGIRARHFHSAAYHPLPRLEIHIGVDVDVALLHMTLPTGRLLISSLVYVCCHRARYLCLFRNVRRIDATPKRS